MGGRAAQPLMNHWALDKMWILNGGGVLGDAIAADSPTTLWVYKVQETMRIIFQIISF